MVHSQSIDMKTPLEILQDKKITPETKHHSYKYLYNTMLEIMNKYYDEIIRLEEGNKPNIQMIRIHKPIFKDEDSK